MTTRQNKYATTPGTWPNLANNSRKKDENDEDIDLNPSEGDIDESDDELGENNKEGDSHAEDESDDEIGEKEEDEDNLDLEDESGDDLN